MKFSLCFVAARDGVTPGKMNLFNFFLTKACAPCQKGAIIAFFAAHDNKQVAEQDSEKFFKN
ncbi:hypothetical protein JY96_12945 [Aquabacterium sp. NJ1]|nr:hypothetical protein JY96_12945 [Aquabacterium sp. NJ1]